MKFNEVIGQEEVKQRLLNMAEEHKIPHALMFCGDMGYGALALALAFASYLLGEREEGTTPNIKAMLSKFQHPDLHFIFPVIRPSKTPADKKVTSDDFIRQWTSMLMKSPYFRLEDWLECIKAENQQAQIFTADGEVISHKLSLTSSQGGYIVCIIWLPERMHPALANKMLKLLEEPPQQIVFIMVSEEPQMLFETIRSRVQRIDIKRIPDETIEEALVSKRGLDRETAHQVAHIVRGNWLKATEFLNSENEKWMFHGAFVALMRMAYKRDTKEMKKWTESIAKFGREKQRRMLVYISEQVRENFMYNFQQRELVYMTEEEEGFSRNFARFINETNVTDIYRLIDRTFYAIGQNANAKMQFFDFALQTAVLIRRK